MGRFIKFIVGSILIVTISFGIYEITNKYSLNVINKDIEWSISAKGCSGAKAFDFDKDGNLYIAFKNNIKILSKDNDQEVIIRKSSFNIFDIKIYEGDLIIATDNRVVKYNLEKDTTEDLINNLPNKGLNKETKLIINNDKLYITVGTNTNSGIAENGAVYDEPSFYWILTGANYGEAKTGPFSPSGVSVEPQTKVKESALSSGVILCYDLEQKQLSTYATGIRSIEGIDIDSNCNIIAIIRGMEYSGLRPVKDDTDYLYEIKERGWYGWPDFSGGDPITSARFSDGDSKLEFLISNHPTEVPYGPIYQHSSLGALKGLAIDTEGLIFLKDTMIVGDNKEKLIYTMNREGLMSPVVDLGDHSNIEQIKWFEENIYVLDSKSGNLYKLSEKTINKTFDLPKVLWIFIIGFSIIIIVVIVARKKIFKNKLK